MDCLGKKLYHHVSMVVLVIRSIHGPLGGLFDSTTVKYRSGPWYYILKLKEDLQHNGISLPSMFKRKVGNGQSTSFWNDIWFGGPSLSSSFQRVIGLSSPPGFLFHWAWRKDIRTAHGLEELNNLINLLAQSHLSEQPDSWECTLNNSRSFTIQGMRSHITSLSNLDVGHPTRWNKGLPIKLNIDTWCVSNGGLPTRSNLDLRGIDLHSVRCPMCDNDIDTEEHVFVSCPIAVDIWKQVLNLSKSFPNVSLNFVGGATMQLRPQDYLFRISEDVVEVWCIAFYKSADQRTTILGEIVLKDKIIVYDLGGQRIGWVDHDFKPCTQISIKLNMNTQQTSPNNVLDHTFLSSEVNSMNTNDGNQDVMNNVVNPPPQTPNEDVGIGGGRFMHINILGPTLKK
ncbi:RNA-directed DNA polymerase, eukaryota, Reverse transcriptase zinc-binding domain protein [Artemisia annua]|uniref:RNA-directed DNA polymerase, eukaryota, Reverse transcriptase zinc-binding domain protein n=1 Tax=Artemisia annua TaxID=35608 RepID=A0A2U1LIV9_ARTAN|nr:RNA-directed DNA polymerase, eukaryota, Reverse transcriptase zinc-binding domain protein [Artemisia annua]